MTRRRVGRHLSGGEEPEEERVQREQQEALREALSYWASGITLVAVSLGGNAAVLPFLEPGASFAVSLLTADQRGVASRYADTFPVGPSPFADTGEPVVEGALAGLVCTAEELLERGDHTLVIARVTEATTGGPDAALAYFRRDYHRVG